MKLKSIISSIVCFICTAVCFYTVPVQAAETYKLSAANYKVIINGSEYQDANLPILNYQGRTYAPMRSMLEAAGCEVDFSNGAATVQSGGTPVISNSSASQTVNKEYILTKANYKVVINGKDYQDDSFPILNYDGRTYAPMRSMLEAAGLTVDFANSVATVKTSQNSDSGNPNINDYMTIREIFESTNLMPSFNMDNRTVEVYNSNKELLLVIPKEYTHEFDRVMMILKSYYESDLKPLIDKNK